MVKIYKIKHFWAGDEPPTEYLMACDHEPTEAEAVAECQIDFNDSHETLEVDHVFVEGGTALVDVSGVDWDMLRAQKQDIVNVTCDATAAGLSKAQEDSLQGIINLIDSLQDQAALTLGEEAVFGKRAEE